MLSMSDLEQSTITWPTKKEVADRLGVSTKTIEKYVQDGKLEQRLQAQINRPARAVINPASFERFMEERSRGVPVAAGRSTPEPSSQGPSQEVLRLFAEAHWPPPLFLTTEQAVRYSGLSTGYLNRLVNEGRLKRIEEGIQGYRYRRADLEAL